MMSPKRVTDMSINVLVGESAYSVHGQLEKVSDCLGEYVEQET